MPEKNPTAFFPTPKPLVDLMLDVTGVPWGGRVLEPSAGTGAIARAIRERATDLGYEVNIDCCEFLGVNRATLINDGFSVVAEDFLTYVAVEPYDAVLMNPPFSLEGDPLAYITHIDHAWRMLKDQGCFAAIVPPGWLYNSTKRSVAFREWVCDRLFIEEIGSGAFKESGTMVNTFLIYGSKDKGDVAWRTLPCNGWPSYHAWHLGLMLDNDCEIYRRISDGIERADFDALVLDFVDRTRRSNHVAVVARDVELEALWLYYAEG